MIATGIGVAELGGNAGVAAALARSGEALVPLGDLDSACDALAERRIGVLIVDAAALDPRARALLEAARGSGVPALLVGRDRGAAAGVEALHAGATDYLCAPVDYDALQRALARLAGAAASRPDAETSYVTADPEARATLALLRSVAPSDATVLIEGESGTGKELLAQLVHNASPRSAREIVSVNCAALPSGLLESELFGHERGAFTGAVQRSIGKFELAHGSTILLDEIGELELGLQAKLLRVLQEKEIQRIGARRPIPVDFRLVATTNRELRAEVEAGRFREDLFYRLNVLPVRLRPLRDRPGDVRLLVDHFLGLHGRSADPPRLADGALRALEAHDWPGNARELENLIERLAITHAGRTVEARDLQLGGASARAAAPRANDVPPFRTLREMERWLIVETLRRTDGNRTRASRELGISLRTLRNKIREYQIDEPDTLPRTGLARPPAPAPSGGQISPGLR